MSPTTEYDPNTLKRVVNHDAQRRQKQLDEVMAKIGAEQPGLVEHPHLPPAPEPVSVEPAPVVPPTIPMVAEDLQLPELPPLEPVVAEPIAPTQDVDAEMKLLRKRYEDANRALTPFQQKAARLDKELREEREATRLEIQSLKELVTNLAQTVTAASLPKPEPMYDPDLDSELDNIDPMLAERFRRLNRSVSQQNLTATQRLMQEIEDLKRKEQERQNESRLSMAQNQEQVWDATFTRLVPDFQQFLPGTPHGQNLATWAANMAPEYAAAIETPKSFSPSFVAQVINAYKASLRPAAPARKPSLGDLANPVLSGSAPVKVSAIEPESWCSDYEMQNAPKIMDSMMRQATSAKHKEDRAALLQEANDFSEKYQRTLQKRMNSRG